MYHLASPEIMSGAVETVCYMSTVLAAVIGCLLTLRF
jgi:hypothetical protein